MTSLPSHAEVQRLHAYWQASNYLCAGMLARVPRLRHCGAAVREQWLARREQQVAQARAEGIDSDDIRDGRWPTYEARRD